MWDPAARLFTGMPYVAAETPGFTFSHEETQTGGLKHPKRVDLHAHHPDSGEPVGTLHYFPPKRRGGVVDVDELKTHHPGAGSALLNEMEARHPGSRTNFLWEVKRNNNNPDVTGHAGEHAGNPSDWDTHYPNLAPEVHRGLALTLPQQSARVVNSSAPKEDHLAELHAGLSGTSTGTHWTENERSAQQFAHNAVSDYRTTIPVVLHSQTPQLKDIETRREHLYRGGVFPYGHPHSKENEVPVRKGRNVTVTGISWRPDAAHPDADENGWVHHTYDESMQRRALLGAAQPSIAEAEADNFDGDNGPPPCSYCGNTEFGAMPGTGRTQRAQCAACGGTMYSNGGQWQPELIGDPDNHPSTRADPASGGVGGAANAIVMGTPEVRTTDEGDRTAALDPAFSTWHLATFTEEGGEEDRSRDEHGNCYYYPNHEHEHHDWDGSGEVSCPYADTHTDWDQVHPHLGDIHRGMSIDLHGGGPFLHGHVHDESQSIEDRGRALADHMRGGDVGTHWTPDEEQAHHYAEVGAHGYHGAGHTPVVLHAAKPHRDDIDTDPESLEEGRVIGFDAHDDAEVPLQSGAPVHVKGVSWHANGKWHRYDYPQPAEHTAARHTAGYDSYGEWDGRDDDEDEERTSKEWDERHPNIEEMHRGIGVMLPDELHRFVHDRSKPVADRAHALLKHVSRGNSITEGLGRHWTDVENVAHDFARQDADWKAGEDKKQRRENNDFSWGHEPDDHEIPHGKPATQVVFHSHQPPRESIDHNFDPNGDGSGAVYGYDEHGESEIPIHHGASVPIKGITFKQHKTFDDETPEDWHDEGEHHEFAETQHHSAALSAEPCPTCEGKGHYMDWELDPDSDSDEPVHVQHECPDCDGVGQFPAMNDAEEWHGAKSNAEQHPDSRRAQKAFHETWNKLGAEHEAAVDHPEGVKKADCPEWCGRQTPEQKARQEDYLRRNPREASFDAWMQRTGTTMTDVDHSGHLYDMGLPALHEYDRHDDRLDKLETHYKYLHKNVENDLDFEDHQGHLYQHHAAHGVPMFDHESHITVPPMVRAKINSPLSMLTKHTPPRVLPTVSISNEYADPDLKGALAYHHAGRNHIGVHADLAHEAERSSIGTLHDRDWFSPSGNSSLLRRTMSHEYGHLLDAQLEPKQRSHMLAEVSHSFPTMNSHFSEHQYGRGADPSHWMHQNREHLVNHVSTYGATNDHELVAELYAEHKHAFQPSEAASIVGRHLEGAARDNRAALAREAGIAARGTHAQGADAGDRAGDPQGHQRAGSTLGVIREAMPGKHTPPAGLRFSTYNSKPGDGFHEIHDYTNPGWSHHILHAHLPGVTDAGGQSHDVVGHLRYSRSPEGEAPTVAVHNMQTQEEYQGRGVASAMQDELHRQHPGHYINHGERTDEGISWADQYHVPADHPQAHSDDPLGRQHEKPNPGEVWDPRESYDPDAPPDEELFEPEQLDAIRRARKRNHARFSTMRHTAISWDEIGDRHPHVYGDADIHGEAADGADGPGIGDAANYLAHERAEDPDAENSSVHDLDFHEEHVHPRHIDYNPSEPGDYRVTHAREGYQRHPEKMPPLVLVHRHGVYQVADGHHRAQAAASLDKPVKAYVAHSPYPDEPFRDGEKAPFYNAVPTPLSGGGEHITQGNVRDHLMHDHGVKADTVGKMNDFELGLWHETHHAGSDEPMHHIAVLNDEIPWCAHLYHGNCTYPGDKLPNGTILGIPQDRGPCPWKRSAFQQAACPISDPGPMAVMQVSGGKNGELPGGLTFDYKDRGDSHKVMAIHPTDGQIGQLTWFKQRNSSHDAGEVDGIEVDPGYQRHGVASAMWNHAHSMDVRPKPRHSSEQTGDGSAWAQHVGVTR